MGQPPPWSRPPPKNRHTTEAACNIGWFRILSAWLMKFLNLNLGDWWWWWWWGWETSLTFHQHLGEFHRQVLVGKKMPRSMSVEKPGACWVRPIWLLPNMDQLRNGSLVKNAQIAVIVTFPRHLICWPWRMTPISIWRSFTKGAAPFTNKSQLLGASPIQNKGHGGKCCIRNEEMCPHQTKRPCNKRQWQRTSSPKGWFGIKMDLRYYINLHNYSMNTNAACI